MTLLTHDTHNHIPVTLLPENNANTGSEYIIHSQQTNDSLKSKKNAPKFVDRNVNVVTLARLGRDDELLGSGQTVFVGGASHVAACRQVMTVHFGPAAIQVHIGHRELLAAECVDGEAH